MPHYAISVVPDAERIAMNRLIAAIEGEDPLASENLTQRANASGSPEDATTHWYGGRWVGAEWLARYQSLGGDITVSGVDFPVSAGGQVVLSEEAAALAAAALVITVTTSDEGVQQPQQTLAAAMDALGLKPVVFE